MRQIKSKPLYQFYNENNELVLETEDLETAQNFLKPGVEYEKELKIGKHITKYTVYNNKDELVFECKTMKELSDKYKRAACFLEKRINSGLFNVSKDLVISVNRDMYYHNICIMREPVLKTTVKRVYKKARYGIIPEDKRDIIENLPGEVWKMIDDGFNYNWCSNKGRFKIVDAEGNERLRKTMKSMGGRDHNKEYHDITLYSTIPGVKSITCRSSRAIAKTFIDPTLELNTTKNAPRKVDHKDNNTNNECVDNLRILSHSENLKAAYNEQGVLRTGLAACRKCYAEKDGERREYNTTAALVRDLTGKNNGGYFQTAMLAKNPKLRGWNIGYLD